MQGVGVVIVAFWSGFLVQMANEEAGEMLLPILNRLGWGFIPLAAGNKRLEGRKTQGQTALPPWRAAER